MTTFDGRQKTPSPDAMQSESLAPEADRSVSAVGTEKDTIDAAMTPAERFWYAVECIAFGGGYFAKIPAAKALDEVDGTRLVAGWAKFWYVMECIAFGFGYLAKIPTKRALEQRDASRSRRTRNGAPPKRVAP